MTQNVGAVVPGYYLVCYNGDVIFKAGGTAVVPGYYLVCYNSVAELAGMVHAVVPGYYLVCYNSGRYVLSILLL